MKNNKPWTPEQFIAESSRIQNDKDLGCDAVRIGAMMLAALQVGPNFDRLCKFFAWENDLAGYWQNLERARVVRGGKLHVEWFHPENGGVSFLCDVATALGWLKRAITPRGRRTSKIGGGT